MSKQLTINYEDKAYILEYTRKSVEQMERTGFVAEEVRTKPMTTLPALFAGAFIAHHRFVKQEVIDKIFRAIPNKVDLIGKLAEMYNEPLEALFDEDSSESEGNISWTPNW